MVKLTDFGIAKLLDAQGVTSTGQVLGSPAHMAPEQIEGGEVDARADVFGLGVLLYESMVGHLPFEGQNPAQVLRRVLDGTYPEAVAERPVVGKTWSALLDRALAHAQAERFPDAGAMKAAIVAELDRLAFPGAEGELEAWLDDPDAYEAAHAKRMIDRLCTLADDARKKGNVLAAAADYNRALAHAPDDPHLLRIVAGMNRAEARARFMKRGLSALALAALLHRLVLTIPNQPEDNVRQQDSWEIQKCVDQHDVYESIEPAAKITGKRADGQTGDSAREDDADTNKHRDARAK